MKIHEYQAKNILKEFNIPTPQGIYADTVEQAMSAAEKFNYKCVLKAQVHAGGRGKAGGIKLVNSKEGTRQAASALIGMKLVSHQTGEEGKLVRKLLVEEITGIAQELYLGIVPDRASGCPVIMASQAGGMDIEKIAAEQPELIIKEYVDPLLGLKRFQCSNIVNKLNLPQAAKRTAVTVIENLYRVFEEKDCSLIEINPLVITSDEKVLALDAKINFDESALFRHPELIKLRDTDEEDPLELEASKHGLNYIKLSGNVGCMVNGAGLAMATMDTIKLAGAEPANFLDVGGGASAEAIEQAFKILLSDKNVKVVLINIFGGILRCDRLANGLVEAAQKVQINLPIIIRLEGTNSEQGRKTLEGSDIKFKVADSMARVAEMVAEEIKIKV